MSEETDNRKPDAERDQHFLDQVNRNRVRLGKEPLKQNSGTQTCRTPDSAKPNP